MRHNGLIALLFVLAACAPTESERTAVVALQEEREAENKQIALAMGERIFSHENDLMLKALIASMTDLNMAVTNIDRKLGFIVAEGTNLISRQKMEELLRENARATLRISGRHPNQRVAIEEVPYKIRLNANLFPSGPNATKVKIGANIRFRPKGIDPARLPGNPHIFMPNHLREVYRVVWQAIDKQAFVVSNTEAK